MTDTCCCEWMDQAYTDDGDLIYDELCSCICHTEDEE